MRRDIRHRDIPIYADVSRGRGGLTGLFTFNNDESTVTSPVPKQFLGLDGKAGGSASTADSIATSIVGDLQMIAKIDFTNYFPTTSQEIISKRDDTVSQASYNLLILSGYGGLRLNSSANGITSVARDCLVTLNGLVRPGTQIFVKGTLDVDNGAGGNDANFYISYDYDADLQMGTWTQLGATITNVGITSIFDSSAALTIGSRTGNIINNANGKIYRAQVFNGIGGTLVADFNPNDADLSSTIPTSFTSKRTGEIYTINGTATIRRQ